MPSRRIRILAFAALFLSVPLLAHAAWIKGHTGKSDLSPSERAALLSPGIWMPPAEVLLNAPLPQSEAPKAALPAKLDWHDKDGADWCSPVRDQGHCGACWAFGSVAVMEAMVNIYLGDPTYDIDLSEQSLVSCGTLGSCASGGMTEEVWIHAKSEGVPDEACFPYEASDVSCARCSDYAARSVKLSSYKFLYLKSETVLKEELLNGPLAVTMTVYDDFYDYNGGVYEHECGLFEATNHIILLVGWDDSDNSWIVKNSWNTDWGLDGYFKIKRGSSCLAKTAYSGVIDPTTIGVTPGKLCASQSPLVFDLAANATGEKELPLQNCGGLAMDFTASTATSWLSLDPPSGRLEKSANATIKVRATAGALGSATQTGEILLKGNATTVKVPVVLSVLAEVTDGDTTEAESEAAPDGDTEAEAEVAPTLDGDTAEAEKEGTLEDGDTTAEAEVIAAVDGDQDSDAVDSADLDAPPVTKTESGSGCSQALPSSAALLLLMLALAALLRRARRDV